MKIKNIVKLFVLTVLMLGFSSVAFAGTTLDSNDSNAVTVVENGVVRIENAGGDVVEYDLPGDIVQNSIVPYSTNTVEWDSSYENKRSVRKTISKGFVLGTENQYPNKSVTIFVKNTGDTPFLCTISKGMAGSMLEQFELEPNDIIDYVVWEDDMGIRMSNNFIYYDCEVYCSTTDPTAEISLTGYAIFSHD